MENNVIIKISHLFKSFGEVKAVNDLSFQVRKGELFAFLGVNGAGKSTTISMICGQLRQDAGEVEINGRNAVLASGETKRELGIVFQDSVLDRPLSVKDNLRSRAALYGITGRSFEKRLGELMELLDFSSFINRPVGKLSGGQRRRIDIARALLHRPEILILDEPTAGLDPKERVRFRNLLSRLSGDRIILLATHIVSDLECAAKEVILLREGRLLQKASPLSLQSALAGKVWLVQADETELGQYTARFIIANAAAADGKYALRIVSDEKPHPSAVPGQPRLEDVYLYYFGEPT
jgi:multidrug/hemolysin transport system ATP-binding protein